MKVFLQQLILMFFLVMGASAFSQETDNSGYWIDVRTVAEFAEGHVEGAVNISHGDISEKIAQVTSNKHAEIHLYCGSGRRAGMAKKALEELGYTNVINDGGYKDIMNKR